MKNRRILHSIIKLSLLCLTVGAHAQTVVVTKADTTKQRHNYPLFNGVMVGVNIADPILRAFGQEYGGYEGVVEVNLHNRFFPEISFGIGSAKHTSERDFHYEGKPAFFGRIGMNYNFRYNSDVPNYLIVGLRYGFSSYRADITNLSYNNGYWDSSGPYNLPDQKFNSHWLEIGAGIRVKVFKKLYMGWMLYFKPLLKEGNTKFANPWYIPGYGANGKGFGFNYTIYYKIP
ncbi:MAG: DUF6048 family protein [Bacteroidales bacterium]